MEGPEIEGGPTPVEKGDVELREGANGREDRGVEKARYKPG